MTRWQILFIDCLSAKVHPSICRPLSGVGETFSPWEVTLLFPALAAGLTGRGVLATAVLLELPGLGEAAAAALAPVQFHPSVDLHVGLELVGLPEAPAAHGAFVGFLSGVDQQVALVVLPRPELLLALVALVRLDVGVQQLVAFQLRREHEALVADGADVRPLAAVLLQVVQVQVAQVEGLPAGAAGELLVLRMALLVRLERAAAAEVLQAHLAAEGFDPAEVPPHLQRVALLLLAAVHQLLVLLQLAVVEEGLAAQVAHEPLLRAVHQHVGLQGPRSREAFATFVAPEARRER